MSFPSLKDQQPPLASGSVICQVSEFLLELNDVMC